MHRRVITALAVAPIALSLIGSSAAAASGTGRPSPRPAGLSAAALARAEAAVHALRAARTTDHPRLAASLRDDAGLAHAGRAVAAAHDAAGRVDVVIQTADPAAAVGAVTRSGGRVLVRVGDLVKASVSPRALAPLSELSGVEQVRQPIKAVDAVNDSEGVGETGAGTWQTGGRDGAGQTVAIVDSGFAGYVAAEGTDLPASVTTQNFCTGVGETFTQGDGHGTAVAEIVHDMAPGATIALVCAGDEAEFAQAAQWVTTHGIKIANLSAAFPGAGRGDGSGIAGSPAAVVKASRQAGVLWTVAAGNAGQAHETFAYRDADKDAILETIGSCQPTYLPFDDCAHDPTAIDDYEVIPVAVGGNATALWTLQWDQWPTTKEDLGIYAFDASGTLVGSGDDPQTGTQPPVEAVGITDTSGGAGAFYYLLIAYNSGSGAPRLDVTGFGATQIASPWGTAGSVTEPATSPYVLAVGAHCWTGSVAEDYSSAGPTIDGRTKPDVSGPDAVSSPVYGSASSGCGGFRGTSAAAPHVAGAAALIRAANPALDASQLQAVLQSRSLETGAAGKDNVYGSGLLRMGAADTPDTPAPSKFTALASPVRALDTRTSIGGHPGALAGTSSYALVIGGHNGVPADAKAVVLNLTVVSPSKAGYLSLYPSGSSSTVSNLNFVAGDVRANNATVTIGAADQSVVFYNGSAGPANVVADVVGYYGGTPAGGSTVNGYAPIVPRRILDTRTATGAHQLAMKPNETFNLPVTGGPVPSTATAVALNVTAVLPKASGYLSLYPTGTTPPSTSSLNFKVGQTTPNLVLAGVGTGGKVAIHVSGTNGTLDLVVDVVGYYDPAAANGFVALREPTRILDSRTGNSRLGALAGGTSLHLQVDGLYGVPSTATGAVLNTTVVTPTAGGYLTVWPTGATRPTASNLNFAVGQTVANNVMSGTGTSGQIDIFSSGSTHVLADLAGYFRPFP